MRNNFLTTLGLVCVLTLSSFFNSTRDNADTKEILKDDVTSFYYVLDNRFQGGSDAFIELFKKDMSYPKEAFDNCRVGLSKIKLNISKDGKLENYEFSNKLGMGIEDKLSRFLDSTKDNWKAWARKSEMDLTVGFSLITKSDSYYPDADLLVLEKSAFKYATNNEYCDTDAKVEKRVKKYIKKKKYDKALSFAEELLRRHPDNQDFKNQLALIKNKRKK
ncbi:MAG: hypothetical protein AB8H03_11020 [Saprospiraceae bacterium]